jgi:hypothetical protein
MRSWIDQEPAGRELADERLGKRLGILMEQLSQGIGRTIPLACVQMEARGYAQEARTALETANNDVVPGILATL